ncbi:hypothetical protein ACFLSE_09180 [Bacteroidota bacterium]
MIRVYFDWNVFSNLKEDEFRVFKEKLLNNKSKLLFPYSHAHFTDLMKSFVPSNEKFQFDLDTLSEVCGKHNIGWDGKKSMLYFATPAEFFDSVKDQPDNSLDFDIDELFDQFSAIEDELGFGKIWNTLQTLFKTQKIPFEISEENKEVLNQMFPNLTKDSSMWDFIKEIVSFLKKFLNNKDFYKSFRNTINEKGFRLDPNSSKWESDEVIKQINLFLNSIKENLTFQELVKLAFVNRKEKYTRFEYFKVAYIILDLIGYKRDRLRKKIHSVKNIIADSEHSFYGAHCDYFVAIDKNLLLKSKVLYSEFNISTTVLTFKEFIDIFDTIMHNHPDTVEEIVDETLNSISLNNIVEKHEQKEPKDILLTIKLPVPYLNFFNYVLLQQPSNSNALGLIFYKTFENYADMLYYTETEELFDRVDKIFQFERTESFDKDKQEFIHDLTNKSFTKNIKYGVVRLEREMPSNRIVFQYTLRIK